MASLTIQNIRDISVPIGTSWLLSQCMEAKGKQELWIRQKPAILKALREQAMIQSVESSNRIEGVTIAPARLRPVILGNSRPRDRSEEEIAGYRKALNRIFLQKRPATIDANLSRRLHQLAMGGSSGDAGQWKTKNNEIVEILTNGERRVRFQPTSAKETPRAMNQLSINYLEVSSETTIPILLTIATFVFDFLCIHPFRDGNGRVSRLLTTLLLHQNGFIVGRFVSLEKLVEETKEDYYRILHECSQGWHEGKNDILPWWNYFLSILRQAYGDFAQKVETTSPQPAKTQLVLESIEHQLGEFSLAEIKADVPTASGQLIKKVFGELKKEGRLRVVGRGRGAVWKKTGK